MDFIMYTCPECRKVFKVKGNNKRVKCSKCVDTYLIDLGIILQAWESMSSLTKKSIIEDAVSRLNSNKENEVSALKIQPDIPIHNNAKGIAFKCKMCGGQLEVMTDESVCTCDYCGTTQTLPSLSDEKRASLYDRANHFRRNNEFDKAMGIYEHILSEDETDAEAYWSIVLCRYGIEYVEDPVSRKRKPTVNRTQPVSVLNDSDYHKALENADSMQKRIYEEEAKEIDRIQREIMSIVHKEQPFDIFISYKETAPNGQRTKSSVLAQDLYEKLVEAGYRVFFSRITLEDKLGQQFEPYIYSALSTARIMLVIGTDKDEFNAPWVRNEWNRFLGMMKNDKNKLLIPCYRDMDAYDLPEEMGIFQSQDMSKVGFEQDLIRGIAKIIGSHNNIGNREAGRTDFEGENKTDPLLKRVFMSLEDGEWSDADKFCEQVLSIQPENGEAYLGKLLAELHVRRKEELNKCKQPFDRSSNYLKIMRVGNEELVSTLKECILHINERNKNDRLMGLYTNAVNMMNAAKDEDAYKAAADAFKIIGGFKDSDKLIKQCLDNAESILEGKYNKAVMLAKSGDAREASKILINIKGYRDSYEKALEIRSQNILEKIQYLNVGDFLKFGSYFLNIENEYEEVEWIILEKNSMRALLISRYVLAWMPYNGKWSNGELRNWMNDTFFNTLFDSIEQRLILSTTITEEGKSKSKNVNSLTQNSNDRIFLLSVSEANKYLKPFEIRRGIATNFMKTRGPKLVHSGNACQYWLRTPGFWTNGAKFVDYNGKIPKDGNIKDNTLCGIRPAIWITRDLSYLT